MTAPRVVSYGGGVQSTALMVLAARGVIDFRTFLMANVGADSEDPRTLEYVANVASPYAAAHGLELHLLDRVKRDGTVETLLGRLLDPVRCPSCKGKPDAGTCPRCTGRGVVESRSLPIPVRMDNGAPGNRSCTADFKIKVLGRWVKAHGASGGRRCPFHREEDRRLEVADRGPRRGCGQCTQAIPATVAVGISRDEIHRAGRRNVSRYEDVVYPLVGIGDPAGLNMDRQDCIELIRSEGLPVPPKSSCYFCPFHRPSAWVELRRERPHLFEKSVQLERTLNDRRAALGKDKVWLTRFARPLDEVIGEPEALLPGLDDMDAACDSGRCFT